MGGIKQKNKKEIFVPVIPVVAFTDTLPPWAPTSTADIGKIVVPVSGKLKAVTGFAAVKGLKGSATSLKDTIKVVNDTITGAAGTAMTQEVTLHEVAASAEVTQLEVGTKIVLLPTSAAAAAVKAGDVLTIIWTETPTFNSGTRPKVMFTGAVFEADSNADLCDYTNRQ